MLLNAAIATRMMTAITRASRTRANQRRTEPPTDRCGLAATGSSFGCLCGRRGRPGSRDIASQLFRRRTRSSGSAHERLKTARKSAVVRRTVMPQKGDARHPPNRGGISAADLDRRRWLLTRRRWLLRAEVNRRLLTLLVDERDRSPAQTAQSEYVVDYVGTCSAARGPRV